MNAWAFSQTEKDSLALIQTYYNEANTALKSQQYELAIVGYTKAKQLASSQTFKKESIEIQFALCNINYYLQNYIKAAKDLERILPEIKNLGDRDYLAEAHTLLGCLLYTSPSPRDS